MAERDPRVDPKPGDEIGGNTIKAKVLRVTLEEAGVAMVEYTVAHRRLEYRPKYTAKATLKRWQAFADNAEVIHVVDRPNPEGKRLPLASELTGSGAERDPRVDPMAGDQLLGPKSLRQVGRIFDGYIVGFTYWRRGLEYGIGNDCFCQIVTWRKWARNAEVVRRGDD